MAEINEYLKNKYEDQQKEFEGKIRRHKVLRLYRVGIVVLVVLIIVVSAYINYRRMVYSDYDVLRTIDYTESNNAHYLEFNGNILRYSQDGAAAFNIANDMIWNETFQMQNPIADSCGDYVALGDYMGTTIYIFNSEGIKGTIDTSTPLRYFKVSGNGIIAVVLEEDDITWVKLYDENGTVIANDKTTMAKSGYPVRVDISENGIILAISYLYVESGVLSSTVAFYNFGAVGQNEIDNLVSGYTYMNTIMSQVSFLNSDTAFAIGDNKLSIFKGAQKPERIKDIDIEDEILSVFNNNQFVGLVFKDDNGPNVYKLKVYNDEGEIVTDLGFDIEYNNVSFFKDQIIISNTEECEVYNSKGLEKYRGAFDESNILIVPESRSKYLLVKDKHLEEIKLK